MKRIIALLMTVVIILSMSVVAFAEETAEVATKEELAAAVANGGSIKLTADIELDQTITIAEGKNVVLDLNGKAITVGYQSGSTTNHIYALDNKGIFTLNDSVGTGTVTARGNKNYGTMVMNGGTVVACDTNGGYGIWNYGNFTMNGGTIKVTHVGSYSDTYGPTGLGNMSGATALITGGNFEGKNARAYIIASEGTLEITPAEGKEVKVYAPRGVSIDDGTAVINGGSFTTYDANEAEGSYVAFETYYPIYIGSEDAVVTVNGGDFNAPEQSVWNEYKGDVSIYGGSFNKPMTGKDEGHKNEKITVYGGTYVELPSEYLANGVATASLTKSGESTASVFAVGAASIKELSKDAKEGGVLTITAVGNETVEVEEGTKVVNGTDVSITVNGKEVAAGATEIIPTISVPEVKPSAPCDHKLDGNGKCSKCGVIIVSYENGKPSVSDKVDEANPNTGAEDAIAVVAAIAVLSIAGTVISKK